MEGSRKNLGRRPGPNPPTDKALLSKSKQPVQPAVVVSAEPPQSINHETSSPHRPQLALSPAERGKIQNGHSQNQTETSLPSHKVHPDYWKKGPVITDAMFRKWTPDLLGIPSPPVGRAARSTRNPNPQYVDAVFAA